MKILLNKKIGIITTLVLVVIIISGLSLTSEKELPYDFVLANRGSVVQEVSVTGRVNPLESVSLSFGASGEVADIRVDVGESVSVGDVLVLLKNTKLSAERAEASAGVVRARATLRQTEATLETEEANLAETLRGAREEEVRIKEINVLKAGITLTDAKNGLVNVLKDTYTQADDAVRNKADQLFDNPRTANPSLLFTLSNLQLEINLITNRAIVEEVLIAWKVDIDFLTFTDDVLSTDDILSFVAKAESNLAIIKNFLDDAGFAVNTSASTSGITQTMIDKWKGDVLIGRTNVNAAVSSLTAGKEKLNTAEARQLLADEELLLTNAGATIEQITAARARVKQAEANVASQDAGIQEALARVRSIDSRIEDTILRAPISGTVTIQDATIGETVVANKGVVSLISASDFEIIAHVPEADIASVKEGNIASITLDAYGGDELFEAVVVAIDPAETIIEGVATYKTTLLFTQEDNRVKSGMTADITIAGDSRDNVVIVPLRAVIGGNGDRIVRVVVNGVIEERVVELGLRGSDGNIEITSGVAEGDQVVIFLRDK